MVFVLSVCVVVCSGLRVCAFYVRVHLVFLTGLAAASPFQQVPAAAVRDRQPVTAAAVRDRRRGAGWGWRWRDEAPPLATAHKLW